MNSFSLFIEKKKKVMKNVFFENLFAYPYQNKKSDKIFLLENCVWISISLTKKKKVQKPANEEGGGGEKKNQNR